MAMQSVEVAGAPELQGQTRPRRNAAFSDGLVGPSPSCPTLFEAFLRGVKLGPKQPCLGSRIGRDPARPADTFAWQTYADVHARLLAFADGLAALGIEAEDSEDCLAASRLAIWSVNRPEWTIADYAALRQSLTVVSIYDTLTPKEALGVTSRTRPAALVLPADKVLPFIKASVIAAERDHGHANGTASSTASTNGAGHADELDAQSPSLQLEPVMASTSAGGSDHVAGMLAHTPRLIVLDFETLPKKVVLKCQLLGVRMHAFEDVERLGKGKGKAKEPPKAKADTIAAIVFSSGTSGKSRAVALTNGNLTSNLAALELAVQKGHLPKVKGTDMVHFSYLPLSHIYERLVQAFVLMSGGSIGFYSRTSPRILEDLSVLKPTLLVSVPLLLERIMSRIRGSMEAQTAGKKYLIETAVEQKLRVMREGGGEKSWLLDRWVLSAIRERLGGRLRWILSGSAPLTAETMEMLRVSLSVQTSEGFGLTESAAACCMSLADDWEAGHVGPPLASCEVKLVDVPDLYLSTDKPHPRGEIYVRGHCVSRGYLSPDGTSLISALDADGWLATGDVGSFDSKGRLKVIDRKGDVFKLANGEFVTPSQIEMALLSTAEVAQVAVYGDPSRVKLVGIVHVDEEPFLRWLEDEGVELEVDGDAGPRRLQMSPKDRAENACRDPMVRSRFVRRLRTTGRRAGLKGYELPAAVHMTTQPFEYEDAGLVTPTLKIKRRQIMQHFGAVIERMYRDLAA